MIDLNKHLAKTALHLNLSQEFVINLFLDNATAFLNDYVGSKKAASIWRAAPEFWVWWLQVWVMRDKMLFRRYPRLITIANRKQLYQIWHSPKYMQFRPNSMVYNAFIRTLAQRNITLNQLV